MTRTRTITVTDQDQDQDQDRVRGPAGIAPGLNANDLVRDS